MEEARRLHSARTVVLEDQVRRLTEERDRKRDDHATKLHNCIDEWTLKLDSAHERKHLAHLELEKYAWGVHYPDAAEAGLLEAEVSQSQSALDVAWAKGKDVELSCPVADDGNTVQEAAYYAVESYKRSLEVDRALGREWGKRFLDYRDAVYTRHRNLDLSSMDVYFAVFFNMADLAEPPPGIVPAPPEHKS